MMKRILHPILILACCFGLGCGWFGTRTVSKYETCQSCKSIRTTTTTYKYRFFSSGTTVTYDYKSPKFASCTHKWELGISHAYPDGIPDGLVVLVRAGKSYGAFILKNQKLEPETMSYDWYYRSDGKGILDPDDPAVKSGSRSGSPITFGPFRVQWSGSSEGSGIIYYARFASERVVAGDTHICVTEWRSLKDVGDASDPKWTYQASIVDSGS